MASTLGRKYRAREQKKNYIISEVKVGERIFDINTWLGTEMHKPVASKRWNVRCLNRGAEYQRKSPAPRLTHQQVLKVREALATHPCETREQRRKIAVALNIEAGVVNGIWAGRNYNGVR